MDQRIPRFALGVALVLLVFGIYLTITAFVDPASLVRHFDRSGKANAQIQLMLAGRFLAMVLALAVAVALRSASMLALVLGMRLATEVIDAVAFLRAGSSLGYTVIVVALLELAALATLVQRNGVASPAGRPSN